MRHLAGAVWPEELPEEQKTGRRAEVGWRWLVAVFLLLCAMVIVLSSPLLAVREVVVRGNQALPAWQIEQLADIRPGQPLLLVDKAAIEKRLLLHPRILSARVTRRWPSTVIITVRERRAVALLPAGDDFLALDQDGIPFSLADPAREAKLPVITGLRVPSLAMGVRLKDTGLERVLALLEVLPEQLQGKVAEIHVSELAGEPVLRLYLASLLAVDMPADPARFGEALSRLVAILPHVSTYGAGWVLDLSSSTGALLRQEGK
ncbi:MAG: FtsQ-type POTRA domain-containing protein [Limnochordales bacterium]|nr:FtsQ-type POTRA domain-containing protein [Limnochordales bacterium]